jgi:hypothetical protein
MRRKKRVAVLRIALATGLVAMFTATAAQAKPLPSDQRHRQAMPVYVIGSQTPDDRGFARSTSEQQRVVPYLSQGQGVTSAELGSAVSMSPDDRPYPRPMDPEIVSATSDGGTGIDANLLAVTGFALALMLGIGMGVAFSHSRWAKPVSA